LTIIITKHRKFCCWPWNQSRCFKQEFWPILCRV